MERDAEGRGEVDLDADVAALIDSVHDRLEQLDFFTLFEVDLNASADVLRRAYFRRSRTFHPDRYFRRRLGPYKKKLERIFAWMAAAYEFLKVDRHRAAYRKKILDLRDRSSGGLALGGYLVAVQTAKGLEFQIIDEKVFFAPANEVTPTPSPTGTNHRAVLPQQKYTLPRLRRPR